jgi:hypothetical protein
LQDLPEESNQGIMFASTLGACATLPGQAPVMTSPWIALFCDSRRIGGHRGSRTVRLSPVTDGTSAATDQSLPYALSRITKPAESYGCSPDGELAMSHRHHLPSYQILSWFCDLSGALREAKWVELKVTEMN